MRGVGDQFRGLHIFPQTILAHSCLTQNSRVDSRGENGLMFSTLPFNSLPEMPITRERGVRPLSPDSIKSDRT